MCYYRQLRRVYVLRNKITNHICLGIQLNIITRQIGRIKELLLIPHFALGFSACERYWLINPESESRACVANGQFDGSFRHEMIELGRKKLRYIYIYERLNSVFLVDASVPEEQGFHYKRRGDISTHISERQFSKSIWCYIGNFAPIWLEVFGAIPELLGLEAE